MKTLLYIFPGATPAQVREGTTRHVSRPRTQQYGFEYMASLGIPADAIGRDDALPQRLLHGWLGKALGYRARHLLLYFKTRPYKIVFGAALLYFLPLKKIFGGKGKYVLLNIELARIVRANKERPVRYRLLTLALKQCSAIVCFAAIQKEWLLTECPFLEGNIFVVKLGSDTEFYQAVYEGRNNTVLSVGADTGRDYATLFKAAELLPNTQFDVVCGKHNLVGIESIPQNVQIFFNLPIDELKKKYETAQQIVIATHDDTYTDGADCSGQTVLLDAMACGLPVIATRKAYLEDYVEEGKEAVVVPPYDAHALAERITRLQQEPELRLSLGKAARKKAEESLSLKDMAEDLAVIFRKVLEDSSGSR